MSRIRKRLANTALSATALAFTFGYLGCAYATTVQSSDGGKTSNASQTSGQGSGQSSTSGSGASSGASSTEDAQTRDMMKFSRNGHNAIDAIQLARVAIFDGHAKTAVQLMDTAQRSIAAAQRESHDFKMPSNATGTHTAGGGQNSNQGATMVPVDGRMSLGEEYVATPEKQSHLDKANQHLKNGETRQAMDEFKLAGVDVKFTLVLMPIESSKHDLQMAVTLASAGKYYQSNMELKKIEDNLVLTQESLIDAPRSGSTSGSSGNMHNNASPHPSK